MTASTNIVAALQAVIATGNWDFAGELADENNFVDCLRCFAGPRRLLFSAPESVDEKPLFFMCLFCASCWYAHARHQGQRALAQCTVCNAVGCHRSMEELRAIQSLEAAERRYLHAHGWTRDGEKWFPPTNYPFKRKSYYARGNAVNAQKQLTYNPAYGGARSEQPG